MTQIRPITDLRNKFTEIEYIIEEPVQHSQLTDTIEWLLDETDQVSAASQERFSHEQAFGKIRESINE